MFITYVIAATLMVPALDERLTWRDADKILEIIVEAKTKSRELGLALTLPDDVVTNIHTAYAIPKIHLYRVIEQFLKTSTVAPTWRTILAALRNPAVNLYQLATRVEAAHSDPTAPSSPGI